LFKFNHKFKNQIIGHLNLVKKRSYIRHLKST